MKGWINSTRSHCTPHLSVSGKRDVSRATSAQLYEFNRVNSRASLSPHPNHLTIVMPSSAIAPASSRMERTIKNKIKVQERESSSPRQTTGEPTCDRHPRTYRPRPYMSKDASSNTPVRCIECIERGGYDAIESPSLCPSCTQSLSTQRQLQSTLSSSISRVKVVASNTCTKLLRGAAMFPVWHRRVLFPSSSFYNRSQVLPQQQVRLRMAQQHGHQTYTNNKNSPQPCMSSPINLTGIALVALVFIAMSVLVDGFEGATAGIGRRSNGVQFSKSKHNQTPVPIHMIDPFVTVLQVSPAVTPPPHAANLFEQINTFQEWTTQDWTAVNELTFLTVGMFCVVTIWALVVYVKLIWKKPGQLKHLD